MRLIKSLEQMKGFFGEDRRISVSRELTKIYEETLNGTFTEVINLLNVKSTIKGEIVIIIEGQ